MLATEPTMVRLPASVANIAVDSHISCGSANSGIQLLASSTNGTLLTSCDSTAVKRPNSSDCGSG